MTTEDDFQAALDASPEDWQTRLVFADWLEERNDPRAAYFRLAGEKGWRPSRESSAAGFSADTLQRSGITGDSLWRFYNSGCTHMGSHCLPFDLGYGKWLHNSRRAAEDAAALAFAALPEARRAELLGAPAPKGRAKRPRKPRRGPRE
jgi:uncharacterized protein (TIGR02996 family)